MKISAQKIHQPDAFPAQRSSRNVPAVAAQRHCLVARASACLALGRACREAVRARANARPSDDVRRSILPSRAGTSRSWLGGGTLHGGCIIRKYKDGASWPIPQNTNHAARKLDFPTLSEIATGFLRLPFDLIYIPGTALWLFCGPSTEEACPLVHTQQTPTNTNSGPDRFPAAGSRRSHTRRFTQGQI